MKASATEAPRHLSLPTKKGVRIALERRGFRDVIASYDSAWMAAGHFGPSGTPGPSTRRDPLGTRMVPVRRNTAF